MVPRTLWTERAGILAVAAEINRLGLIWREQPNADVGIDGQIELVDSEGRATGRVAAVQVKSGASYLNDGGDHWIFHPDPKHRFYWEIFPLPVLLMLHSPADTRTFWIDARQTLRAASASEPIRIAKTSILQFATAAELFHSVGGTSTPPSTVAATLVDLCTTSTEAAGFCLTYFDLFVHGLTNVAHSLYFGVDLAMELAEAKLVDETWIHFGAEMHEFLLGFLSFVVERNLANVDVSACMVDWHTRQMLPTTIAPLTSRGRELVSLIHSQQARFVREGRLNVPQFVEVAQEDFVRMAFTSSHHARIPIVDMFQRLACEERQLP